MSKPRIRIMDDDPEICEEIAGALEAHGYRCTWATSAAQPLDADDPGVDVLVLDLGLPNADGFQVIETLAETHRPPALIIASGYDSRIIRAAVRSAEAAGLAVLGALEKPYSIAALIRLIDRFTAQRRPCPRDETALVRDLAASGRLLEHVRTAFQSKRRLSDEGVAGYEALLRLSCHGQAVNPERVFDGAISLAAQVEVTGVVLDDAMRFASILRATDRVAPVSVNCNASILCAPGFPDLVSATLERWQLPPSSLVMEITEQESALSFDHLAAAASRMALRGFRISVDDFGRGATSLERLIDLPLTELKVDKAIFWSCVDGRLPLTLLEQITRYCADRVITSTVEGIESTDHLRHARAVGADQGQGYLWDKPVLAFPA